MRTIQTVIQKKHQYRLILILSVMILISISCSLPSPLSSLFMSNDERLTNELVGAGLDDVDQVVIDKEGVLISYQVFPDESLEVMVSNWAMVLSAAAKQAPNAASYTLHTTWGGKPYLDIEAEWDDIQDYLNEKISLDDFLEKLEVIDQRPLEVHLAADLLTLGLDGQEILLDSERFQLTYHVNPILGPGDLIQAWWEIFAVLGQYEIPVDTLQIQAVMGDGSIFLAEVSNQDLAAYLVGEISAVEFLAGIQITEELAP